MSVKKRSRKESSPVGKSSVPQTTAEKLFVEKPWFKFWPEGVPKHIGYPLVPLAELLRKSAQYHPDQTATVYFDKGMTYGELDKAVDRFASALSALEVKKGDKVAIFLPNTPQFVISYYGALRIGAIETAISPLYREREVEHQLRDSQAKTIVILDALYPILDKVLSATKVKNIIVTNLKDYMPSGTALLGSLFRKIPSYKVEKKPGVFNFKELLAKHEEKPPQVEINPEEDLAALQYTGGTTGIAKAAMLTHLNLVSNAVMCAEWLKGKQNEETFLTVLPLFHIYGMTTGMNAPIHLGGKMIMLPRFDALATLEAIQKNKVTLFCGAPTMYAMLLADKNVQKYNLSTIRFCTYNSIHRPNVEKQFSMSIAEWTRKSGKKINEPA